VKLKELQRFFRSGSCFRRNNLNKIKNVGFCCLIVGLLVSKLKSKNICSRVKIGCGIEK